MIRVNDASLVETFSSEIEHLVAVAMRAGSARGYLDRAIGIHASLTATSAKDGGSRVLLRWVGPWEDGGTIVLDSVGNVCDVG